MSLKLLPQLQGSSRVHSKASAESGLTECKVIWSSHLGSKTFHVKR